MLNLFPGEKPVYEPIGPEDDTWAVVTLEEDTRCHVTVELSWQGKAIPYTVSVPLEGNEFQREGQRRRAIGRCFFLAAQAVTGRTPPWGMLTGVRPVKLPTRSLLAGASPEQARKEMEELYYVSPRRASLAVDCAQASAAVDRDLRDDQVSVYIGIPFCPTRCAYCSFVSADVGRTLKLVEQMCIRDSRPCRRPGPSRPLGRPVPVPGGPCRCRRWRGYRACCPPRPG